MYTYRILLGKYQYDTASIIVVSVRYYDNGCILHPLSLTCVFNVKLLRVLFLPGKVFAFDNNKAVVQDLLMKRLKTEKSNRKFPHSDTHPRI
jgi:hypothetical protein